MMSVAAVSAGQAKTYFAKDYYTAQQQESSTRWQGKGAEALGLTGPVRKEAFGKMLDGILPDGTQLGRINGDGVIEHQAGWDITLSSPKSYSIAALVFGDDRLLKARDEVISMVLAYIERECATARIKVGGEITKEATGNLIFATFGHDTNRAEEPQDHTHCVCMNASQTADEQWRSIESKQFYQIQLEAGQMHRSLLAQKARELGYTPVVTRCGEGISFELKEVPKAVIEAFSRRSAEIEKYLADRGLTRKTATAEQKQAAVLATRKGKELTGTAELLAHWLEQIKELGLDIPTPPTAPTKALDVDAEAAKAVAFAIAKLAENNSVFDLKTIKKEAEAFAFGKASKTDIEAAIAKAKAKADGNLLDRHVIGADSLLTTPATIKNERELVANAQSGVGKMQPTLSPEAADKAVEAADEASKAGGHGGLNKGQAEALHGLLTSPDQVVLIQGYAGTAKTNAVLANYSKELAAQGFEVTALAPTSSAKNTLGVAIKADSKTMQSALMSLQSAFAKGDKPEGKQAWILDEASLASTKDLAALTKLASWADVKLVMVGDVKQLGSVEAGAGFRQLQESGIKTLVLDEIVRQKNEFAKGAVYDSIAGDAAAALSKIDKSGEVKEIAVLDEKTGKIDREASRLARVEAIAKDYSSLTREQRADSIIVAPGKDDREQINMRVREMLQTKGEMGEDHAAILLEGRSLGTAESREAQFYTPGDVVSFRDDYPKKRIVSGDYLSIKKVDVETNIITLQSKAGKEIAWNPRQWGATNASSFKPVEKKLAVGDIIRNTKNDHGREVDNGDKATITKIENGKAEILTANGKKLTLDLSNPAHMHLAHGYAQTAFNAQGGTAGAVFVHAESYRLNLINAQSFYVGISRAENRITIYTDSREKLIAAIQERTGQKLTAIEMSHIKQSTHEQFKAQDKEPLPEAKKEREHEGLER